MNQTKKLSPQASKEIIASGKAILGIEFGSTRIKAALIAPDSTPLASGSYEWENSLREGIWTYDLDEVWKGLAGCYADLTAQVQKTYGLTPKRYAAMGFSAMMHGYIVHDKEGNLLTPFRTWRNNITGQACAELSKLFNFAIPQRWSIAHLYQSILENQNHVSRIDYLTTLAGYVHWKLTGQRVLGVGDASGMFPINPDTGDYDQRMMAAFDTLVAPRQYPWKLRDILPRVLPAGAEAGKLSPSGAKLLDPSGNLEAGIPLCPPEGDAGTGMVATNSVRPNTGNVSAGTSVFAMIVLEKNLSKPHEEIDVVTTPDGKPVGMAHSNNGSSDLDAWISLFGQAAKALGFDVPTGKLYETLTPLALQGNADAGNLLHISYLSGEHLTGFSEGRPLFVRTPDSTFTLENVIRSLLFTSLCALRVGLDVLTKEEGVRVKEIRGHGGFFKQGKTGQRLMAAATNTAVSLPATAGEGGAWGMALLAAYLVREQKNLSLPDFLDSLIAQSMGEPLHPDPRDVAGFEAYFNRYKACLGIEREAVKSLK
ncbi:MAG: ATPase [Treponema sp.]|nr:ATPase [Treponema sp.]